MHKFVFGAWRRVGMHGNGLRRCPSSPPAICFTPAFHVPPPASHAPLCQFLSPSASLIRQQLGVRSVQCLNATIPCLPTAGCFPTLALRQLSHRRKRLLRQQLHSPAGPLIRQLLASPPAAAAPDASLSPQQLPSLHHRRHSLPQYLSSTTKHPSLRQSHIPHRQMPLTASPISASSTSPPAQCSILDSRMKQIGASFLECDAGSCPSPAPAQWQANVSSYCSSTSLLARGDNTSSYQGSWVRGDADSLPNSLQQSLPPTPAASSTTILKRQQFISPTAVAVPSASSPPHRPRLSPSPLAAACSA